MQRRQLLLGLLFVVHVALAALVAIPVDNLYEFVFLSVLPASQGSLLAVWAVLAGRLAPWRLVGATALLAFSVWWTTQSPMDDLFCIFFSFWAAWSGLHMIVDSVALLIARLAGMRVTAVPPEDSRAGAGDAVWRPQFSIRSLLEWTAGLAVLLGVSPYLWNWWPPHGMLRFERLILLENTCDALIAFAATWLALGTRWFALRVILLGLAVGASAIATEATLLALMRALALGPSSAVSMSGIIPLYLFHALWLVGSLRLVRVAGYRLMWRGRITL